jgi:hypothetical protein
LLLRLLVFETADGSVRLWQQVLIRTLEQGSQRKAAAH